MGRGCGDASGAWESTVVLCLPWCVLCKLCLAVKEEAVTGRGQDSGGGAVACQAVMLAGKYCASTGVMACCVACWTTCNTN